jgi:hypothetical protein
VKKLNKTQNTELAGHITELTSKLEDIDAAWAKFEEAHGVLADAIGEYNGTLATVTEWRDGIVQEMRDYQGERSDRWQEGEAGQAYESWIGEWEGLDLSEVEVPDMPDQPEPEHTGEIENLPTEADSM